MAEDQILVAIEALGQRFDQLETGQDRLRIDVMARIDRLQNALTVQQEESNANLGAAERAEKIARVAQDYVLSLGESLNILTRQVRRLEDDVRGLKGGD